MPLNQRSFSFLPKLRISTKLLILLVLVGAVSAGTFGVLEYRAAKQSLEEESFKKLTAAREFKGQQIEDYFDTISGQVLTFSESRMTVEAMQAFSRHIVPLKRQEKDDLSEDLADFYQDEFLPRLTRNLKDQERIPEIEDLLPTDSGAKLLQQLYIIENPNPTGEKHLLDNRWQLLQRRARSLSPNHPKLSAGVRVLRYFPRGYRYRDYRVFGLQRN